MALLGNYSIYLKNPATYIGGVQVSNVRSAFNAMGQNRQRYYPETSSGLPLTSALPQGYLSPSAWMIPYRVGGMSMSDMNGTATLTGAGVAGLEGTVTMAGTGVLEATGGLLAGLEVTMAGSGELTLIGGGLLEAIVEMAGSGALTGALGATAGMTVEMAGVGTASFAPSGTGEMEITIYVNEGAATVDQIVDGVVDSLGSITATVPNLLDTETGSVIIPLD